MTSNWLRFRAPTPEESRDHYRFKHSECWSCHQPANHHSGPAEPQPGEVCLCLNCTAINIFAHGGGLREPEPIELANLSLDATVRALQALIQAANRKARRQATREETPDYDDE